MVLGEIPAELKDLTVVEEAMIAKCRAKCWIVQLKEDSGSSPNAQHGIKGHVIIYPQRPSAISCLLPPPINESVHPSVLYLLDLLHPPMNGSKKKQNLLPLDVKKYETH